jgi:hypothetical protein
MVRLTSWPWCSDGCGAAGDSRARSDPSHTHTYTHTHAAQGQLTPPECPRGTVLRPAV